MSLITSRVLASRISPSSIVTNGKSKIARVGNQRTWHKDLSEERKARLNRLGFVWRLMTKCPETTWEERFEELLAFKNRFGHCEVPSEWPENQPLGRWVSRQRGLGEGGLTADQKGKLDEVGFCWAVMEAKWERRFAELVRFHRQQGHCDVARTWPDNPKLGEWVLTQRYHKDTLDAVQREKLDGMGFRWPGSGEPPTKVALKMRINHSVP